MSRWGIRGYEFNLDKILVRYQVIANQLIILAT